MRSSSIILLSGGLDSLASFHWACQLSDVMLGITFDYGQKPAKKEIESSAKICRHYDVKHLVLSLDWFGEMKGSALIDNHISLPELKTDDLDNQTVTQKSANTVWVPNRNGVFINVGASIAESRLANWLVAGFNREEAQTFPDNSEDFVESINESLKYSTREKITLKVPMISKSKKGIVEWCIEKGVDFSNLWSCYSDGDKMCGECESCLRCRRAFSQAGETEWLEKLF